MREPRRSKPPAPTRCPRLDCPDPTLELRYKGSNTQLQYHCYGCWRTFTDGGQQRGWAQQIAPLKKWLLSRPPHLRCRPALLPSPRPSAPPSSAVVQDGDATLYGVAPASTVRLPHAAVPSSRAGVLGEEHGLASEIDVHIANDGGHGSSASSTPAWEECFRLSDFLAAYGEHLFDPESIPAWAISDSPLADGNEVRGANNILPAPASLPSVTNSNNSKAASDSEPPNATDKHLAGVSAETVLKLDLKRYTARTLILKLSRNSRLNN